MIVFLFYLMETFQYLRSLHGYVIFLLLATNSKGSACEAPSSPQCFRQDEGKDVYVCEWDFSTNETNVAFDLYYNNTIDNKIEKIGTFKKNHAELNEETLIVSFKINIWVKARAGNSICTSPMRSGILRHTVKYEAPQNIVVSWMRNNLSLSWHYDYPSLAEVWFRKYKHQTEPWEKRLMNTTNEASTQKLIIANLLRNTAYQVQIRHRSTQAENPLWSNWSPVVVVPAELEQPPVVRIQTTLLNGTRQVMLTWKPIPHAAAVGGVTYNVSVTHSSLKCPCKRKKKSHNISANSYSFSVSYSAVKITVIARNAAGLSPPAIEHLPAAAAAADLKICDKTLLDKKLKETCLEFYELKDADLIPERVLCLTARHKKEGRKHIKNNMTEETRYLYFEHRCHDGKPQTVKMCLYYTKEGIPSEKPQDFEVDSKTHSADLSWKEIPYENLNGVLTHYKLCTLKINSQNKPQVCVNISASVTKYHLKGLTPGTKYNFSFGGVTQAGEGPKVTDNFTTEPEKNFNGGISFGLLLGFFLFSTVCTVILKRTKNKVFPPVPKPVIPDFSPYQPESKKMWERKEEVHEVTLHQLVPEQKPVSEEATALKGEWDDGTEREVEEDGCYSGESDGESSSLASGDETQRKAELKDMEQVETELAMLIYRNGLVFDEKSESL